MFVQVLTHTPPWVYGLFVGLIFLGYQQTRNRQLKFKVAFILPVGMVLLSLAGVYSSFGWALLPIGLWAAGLMLVTAVGGRYMSIKGVRYHPAGYFDMPGSWLPFVVIMAIFFTKYGVGIMSAMQFPIVEQKMFVVVLSSLYGVFSGFFLARALILWRHTAAA